MEPFEHYRAFIEDEQKHVVLVHSSIGKLSITSVKRLNSDDSGDEKASQTKTEKHIFPCLSDTYSELLSALGPIDLLIVHDDYPADPAAISKCNHLELLKIFYPYCSEGGVVLCNARNIRCVKYLPIAVGVRRLFAHNIFAHRSKIRKSGFRIKSQHSIVTESGYPDKIVSFSYKLRQLYYNRSQPQRTLRGRLLVLLLVYSGLAHYFEPGYLFRLQK